LSLEDLKRKVHPLQNIPQPLRIAPLVVLTFLPMTSTFSASSSASQRGVLISKDDLNRMKSSILPSTENFSREQKNKHLKKLSNDRVKNWPNTLEALRKKKESYLKEKEEIEELKRQELDREEAELRRKTRLEAIDRANNLIYEQTDKMKYLRSQELLSDVVYSRGYQINEKTQRKQQERTTEQLHHQEILRQIKENEEIDRKKSEQKIKKMNEVSQSRREQLVTLRQARQKELAEAEAIGLELKQEAQKQIEIEHKLRQEKYAHRIEKNQMMLQTNQELALIRQEYQRLDDENQKRCEEEREVIENRKKVRKALEIRKFEKAQLTRQQIINAATKALEEKMNSEDRRLEKQQEELAQREEQTLMKKLTKQKQDWNSILESRERQIEQRQAAKEKTRQEEVKLFEEMNETIQSLEEKEKEKMKKMREMTSDVKRSQLLMSSQRAAEKEEERLIQQMRDKAIEDELRDNDEKFKRICLSEIERYKADGKPVLPLYRALEHKAPEIMAVTGFRI
jgi:hypothetical protein